jgi:hypothetical protein
MSSVRINLIAVILLAVIGWPLPVVSGEEIEDLIYIAQSDNKIIAIIEGHKPVSFDLRLQEKVLWREDRLY